eukprot:m.51701 g.51701  ORF g.51701 m.51701 type:complete len:1678 (-) comp9069_c0_seq1:2721-7754(-)
MSTGRDMATDNCSEIAEVLATSTDSKIRSQTLNTLARRADLVSNIADGQLLATVASVLCGLTTPTMAERRAARSALQSAPRDPAVVALSATFRTLLTKAPPPSTLKAVLLLCTDHCDVGVAALSQNREVLLLHLAGAVSDKPRHAETGVSFAYDAAVLALQHLRARELSEDERTAVTRVVSSALRDVCNLNLELASSAAASLAACVAVITTPAGTLAFLQCILSNSGATLSNFAACDNEILAPLLGNLVDNPLTRYSATLVCLAFLCDVTTRTILVGDSHRVVVCGILTFLFERVSEANARHTALEALLQVAGLCTAYPEKLFAVDISPTRNDVVESLMLIVHQHWDAPADRTRLIVVKIFRQTIQLHPDFDEARRNSDLQGSLAQIASTLHEMTAESVRGAASCLQELPSLLGANCLLHALPELPDTLIWLVSHAAPPIAKVASTTLEALIKGCPPTSHSLWISQCTRLLCLEGGTGRQRASELLLPRVKKNAPRLWDALLVNVLGAAKSDTKFNEGTLLLAQLTLAKIQGRRCQGGHENSISLSQQEWTSAMIHSNPEVRRDAFALLCESTQFDLVTIEATKEFLRYNVGVQSAGFRAQVIRSFSRFNTRLCKSAAKEAVQLSTWIWKFLLSSLMPGLSGGKTLALELIGVMKNAQRGAFDAEGQNFSVPDTLMLLDVLGDANEKNRILASQLLRLYGATGFRAVWKDPGGILSFGKILSARRDITSASFGSLVQCLVATHCSSVLAIEDAMPASLIKELSRRIAIAEGSLVESSRTAPLYPILQALRCVVDDSFDFQFLDDLFLSLFRAIEIVLPVVSDNYIDDPDVEMSHIRLPEDQRNETECADSTSLQSVVLCCWRTVREAGLTLEMLYNKLDLVVSDKDRRGQLADQGARLLHDLCCARHRGAVDMLQACFQTLCGKFVQVQMQSDSIIPCWDWVQLGIDGLRSAESDSTTRRSAGFPALFRALLSELDRVPENSAKVEETASALFQLAGRGEDVITMTHSRNILCALMKESTLNRLARTLVPTTMALSIDGFQSTNFAIRNTSMRLFAAVCNRAVGTKRVRDEHSTENKPTFCAFFAEYPMLLEVLLNRLPARVDEANTAVLPKQMCYYPALLMLSRLRGGGEDVGPPLLSRLRERATLCLACPVWKVRVLAASVVAELTDDQSYSAEFDRWTTAVLFTPANLSHGYSLAIRRLVEVWGNVRRSKVNLHTLFTCIESSVRNQLPPAITIELVRALDVALPTVMDEHLWALLSGIDECAMLTLNLTACGHGELASAAVGLCTTIICRSAGRGTLAQVLPLLDLVQNTNHDDVYGGLASAISREQPKWDGPLVTHLYRLLRSEGDKKSMSSILEMLALFTRCPEGAKPEFSLVEALQLVQAQLRIEGSRILRGATKWLLALLEISSDASHDEVTACGQFFADNLHAEVASETRILSARGLVSVFGTLGRRLPLSLWHVVLDVADDANGEIRWLALCAARFGACEGDMKISPQIFEQTSASATFVALFTQLQSLSSANLVTIFESIVMLPDPDQGLLSKQLPMWCSAAAEVLSHAYDFLTESDSRPGDEALKMRLLEQYFDIAFRELSSFVQKWQEMPYFEVRQLCRSQPEHRALHLAVTCAILSKWNRALQHCKYRPATDVFVWAGKGGAVPPWHGSAVGVYLDKIWDALD